MRQGFYSLLLCVVLLSSPASAQTPQPLIIGQVQILQSKILGEDRPIVISLPQQYRQSRGSFPVLYLLDGRSNIQHTAGTIDALARAGKISPMIIVGIANTNNHRTRDLTPPTTDQGRFANGGGANNLLDFMEQELFPYIEENYRTQPYRILIGHSFGGLFAVHTLLTRPEMFGGYISISPTLWWDDQRLISEGEEFFKAHETLNKSIYLTLGDEPGGMRSSFDAFNDMLDRSTSKGFRHDSLVMLDENHGSTPLQSTINGLKMIYEGWIIPGEIIQAGDLQGIKSHMAGLSKKFGYELKLRENQINNLGYQVLGNGDLDKAIEIFKYNITMYPDSANTHDSLGEALETAMQLNAARREFGKAVERGREIRDPNTPLYQQHLEAVSRRIENIT